MAKKKNWVLYSDLKAKVSLVMVLERYGLFRELKPSGKNYVGCCPIHQGSNPRQFSVNLERNIWHCFGNCNSGGNILDFVAQMEKVSIREAGLLLKDWFPESIESSDKPPEGQAQGQARKAEKATKLVRKGEEGPADTGAEVPIPDSAKEQSVVNPPLKFELKTLEPDHPFFKERGIKPETVKHFGLGFCSKGLLAGRIAIPIHDEAGKLVAYCGRAVSPEQVEKEGKYKLPGNFTKSAVLYNLHRQQFVLPGASGQNLLVLVESFLSVFKLHQAGLPRVVALMGSILSERQEELLTSFLGPSGRVVLFFDPDEAGQVCTADCLKRLNSKLFVKVVDLSPYRAKPHQLEPEVLTKLLG